MGPVTSSLISRSGCTAKVNTRKTCKLLLCRILLNLRTSFGTKSYRGLNYCLLFFVRYGIRVRRYRVRFILRVRASEPLKTVNKFGSRLSCFKKRFISSARWKRVETTRRVLRGSNPQHGIHPRPRTKRIVQFTFSIRCALNCFNYRSLAPDPFSFLLIVHTECDKFLANGCFRLNLLRVQLSLKVRVE